MDSSELPAGPIDVDSDALVAIDPDPGDLRVPRDVVAVLNRQYTESSRAITESWQRYDHHRQRAAQEKAGRRNLIAAGEHDALAHRAHHDWTAFLGAVAALERLADELQVELDDDRRPYLRPEDRK